MYLLVCFLGPFKYYVVWVLELELLELQVPRLQWNAISWFMTRMEFQHAFVVIAMGMTSSAKKICYSMSFPQEAHSESWKRL